MKLQKTNQGQLFLNVPKALAEAMQWEKGDHIKFEVGGKNKIELRKE